MVIGWFVVVGLSSLASIIETLTTIGVHKLRMQEHLLGLFSMIVYIFALVGLFLLVWRSGQQSNGLIWRIGGWMRTHRIAAAISMFLLLAFSFASIYAGHILTAKAVPMSTYGALMHWRQYAQLVPILSWPFVLAWLLQRITRKAITTSKPERCRWSAEFIPQERGVFNRAADFHGGALLLQAATLT